MIFAFRVFAISFTIMCSSWIASELLEFEHGVFAIKASQLLQLIAKISMWTVLIVSTVFLIIIALRWP